MSLDWFEARVTQQYFDPNCRRYSGAVELFVNGVELLELVRAAERSHAEKEYDERLGTESPPDGERGDLAGQYSYLPASVLLLPSRHLLDHPRHHGFTLEPEDPRNRKTILLECSCGNPGCWMLMAKVAIHDHKVVWSDFEQFHRDWQYDLGPFVFDRADYEAQLVPPSE